MTVTNWQTTFIDGKEYLVIDVAKFRIPLDWDPSSNMFIAVAAPDGGIGNFPALLAGEDGSPPDLDANIDFTVLEPGDATPDFASWTETSPNLYKLSLGLHRGADGTNGSLTLNPADFADPVAGKMLVVAPGLTSFALASPKVGGRYLPATIANTPSGNAAYTLCAVPIPAQLWDYVPEVAGQCVITGTGADARVNLVARLSTAGISNGETAGPMIGQAFGQTGVNPPTHVLSSSPPAGAGPTYDKVLAGNTAVVYLRAERQAGANTFTTLGDTTLFKVKVAPLP